MFWSIFFAILPFALLGIGICLLNMVGQHVDWDCDAKAITGIFLIIFGGVGILINGITIPCSRVGVNAQIQEFHAVVKTAKVQRKSGVDREATALILKIAEMNQWLASAKYYREKFVFWYPKEIENLKPIK